MHLDVQRCHQVYGLSFRTRSSVFELTTLGDLIRYAPNQVLSLHSADMAGMCTHCAHSIPSDSV